jgi:hypothetical protein
LPPIFIIINEKGRNEKVPTFQKSSSLIHSILNTRKVHKNTTIEGCKASGLSLLFCNSETWSITAEEKSIIQLLRSNS